MSVTIYSGFLLTLQKRVPFAVAFCPVSSMAAATGHDGRTGDRIYISVIMNKNLPDIRLAELANKGIEEAMNTLYFRYRDWVYGLAFRLCGNREDAQEVLQEVFIYFFSKFPGFELRSTVKTFLYPVVKNTTINIIRKKRKIVPFDDSAAQSIPDESLNWDAELRNLSEYMDGFSKEDRELVLLRFYDELQLTEIAEVFKVPVGTIKSRLNRLLSRLREKTKK